MRPMMDGLVRLAWWLSGLVMPLTHWENDRAWFPRQWALRLHLNRHPWLWCKCGDSLNYWHEVRTGQCYLCEQLGSWWNHD